MKKFWPGWKAALIAFTGGFAGGLIARALGWT